MGKRSIIQNYGDSFLKTLIVHDREDARDAIKQVLENANIDGLAIDYARDGVSARGYLRDNLYDLLILDLTIPQIADRSVVDYRTASDLLQEIFYLGDLVFPGDIIGITKEIAAAEQVSQTIGPHLMAIIHEKSDSRQWEAELSDKIAYCAAVSKKRLALLLRHHDVDALIVTALDKEAKPFLNHFEMDPVEHFPGASRFLFRDSTGLKRRGILFSVGKSGQASAASYTQSLISYFRPRVAIMSGFCGGVRGKVELGDVFIFDTVYDWDYGKWYETVGKIDEALASEPVTAASFYARPTPIIMHDDQLTDDIRKLIVSSSLDTDEISGTLARLSNGKLTNFSLDRCSAASGSAVVGSKEIVDRIRSLSDDIKAIDMESYGFYHAAKNTRAAKPRFVCVKSVADWSDGTKEDSLHEACCWISSKVVLTLLENVSFR